MKSTVEHKNKMMAAILNSWNKNPDLRFGELIVNAIRNARNLNTPLFYIEDYELEEIIINFANKV